MNGETNSNPTPNMPLEDLAKAKGVELIQKVNAVVKGSVIGVDELKDVVNTFFDLCELIEKKISGQPITLLGIIGEVIPGLLPTFLGGELIPAEASDLQDDEVLQLVSLGDAANLGENAPKYKQVLKMLLFAIQTIFVFKK